LIVNVKINHEKKTETHQQVEQHQK
jgi:hypothetical protein